MVRDVGLKLDEHGWISQQKGRDAYEIAKEPVQNSLDTESDTEITIGYGNQYIKVQDQYPEGVKDLSQFHTLLSGNKKTDTSKRGRFGRGIKELIAAADKTVIQTTGGTAIYQTQLENQKYTFQGTIHEEHQTDRGTYIFAKSKDWNDIQLNNFHQYAEQIIPPENTEITIKHRETGSRPVQNTKTITKPEPLHTLTNTPLKTVQYNETGEKQVQREETQIDIYRTQEQEGSILEMGMPITKNEEFPFKIDIQQRIPLPEQRNTVPQEIKDQVMKKIVTQNLNLLKDQELNQNYVTKHLDQTYYMDDQTQKQYITRRWTQPQNILLQTEKTSDYHLDRAQQLNPDLERIINIDNIEFETRAILHDQTQTVENWVQKRNQEQQKQIHKPTKQQKQFMDFIYNQIINRTDIYGIKQQMAKIKGGEGTETKANYQGNTITYNTQKTDWQINPENIGTGIHELAHEQTPQHGKTWRRTMEKLSGQVILSQHQQIQEMQQEIHKLRQQKNTPQQTTATEQEQDQSQIFGRIREILGD